MTTKENNIPEEMQILNGEQPFYESLGHRMRKYRTVRNIMTAAQIADIAGTTTAQWEKYENAVLAFTAYHLFAVLRYFGFSAVLKFKSDN